MHLLVTSAPWWGAPLIAALALIAGALLAFAGSWWGGKDQQRHSDKRRWDDLILDTAVEVEAICSELAGIGRYGWPWYIADKNDRTDKYIELTDRLRATQARFRMVASKRLRESILGLYDAAMSEFIKEGEQPPKVFEVARKEFIDEVRRELRAN